ncbi:MAG TPA: hypothetical protein VIY48_13825 [Candidatus Paceibacterota bacterium]
MVQTARQFIVKNPLTVIGGIVTLVGMLLLTVWVFSATGTLSPEQRNYAFMSIIGLLLNAIPSLLGLLKSEATQHDIRNGIVKNKVKEAIVEVASDTDAQGVYIDTHSIDTGKETNNG